MKVIYKKRMVGKYVVIYVFSLVVMMISSQVSATCSRDDITFYLDKGFSTDQITVLCSEAPVPAAETSMPEQQPVSPEADDNALFLKRAIKAQKVDLDSSSLIYTQKICIEYGDEDLFGFTPKVCPDVTYMISLKGLAVLSTGKKYGFYGTHEVRVKSSVIKREIIGELKNKEQEERALILEKFEGLDKNDETAIPVRDDFSLEEVKRVLQELSN